MERPTRGSDGPRLCPQVRAGHAAVAALTWQRNAERQLEIYERLPAGRPAASGTRRP